MKTIINTFILLALSSMLFSLTAQDRFVKDLEKSKELVRVEKLDNILILNNSAGEKVFLIFTSDFHKESGYCGFTDTALLLNNRFEVIDLEIISSEDTPSYIRKLKRNKFLRQFMGNPDFDKVETVTGATISSKAVINSIRISLQKAKEKLRESDKDINP